MNRYAVGAMESNKVVFLMDKSGTLVGEPVKLMREMAINIIKTMISDEDYISVLTFNNVVEPLGKNWCLDFETNQYATSHLSVAMKSDKPTLFTSVL